MNQSATSRHPQQRLMVFLMGFVHFAVPTYGLIVVVILATDVWWRQWVSPTTTTIIHASHFGLAALCVFALGIAAGLENLRVSKENRADSWLPHDLLTLVLIIFSGIATAALLLIK